MLYIGIPDVFDDQLIGYDCCLEFPLPEGQDVRFLSGRSYAVLVVDKQAEKIAPAIRSFRGDYLPDHGLIQDEDRFVYEIYYQDTMEHCLPKR